MLQLNNIVKTYVTGDLEQQALKGVSIHFRENEFVSILGQSGSGKTTMLNIIGGLDHYTSGDLIINGVSTKNYTDSDWDYYRNNSIGFVFQSYNLIPHQTVLANVEMALTLAGVSKSERRQRAIEVIKKVGLSDHIHKKPNQMSGGQMQRVAIARALINNPDILLADEPTGALDSETSVQIMELLKEIAKDKLVIMVTHNPELAEQYSTRIVRLKDGTITDDSNPYTEVKKPVEKGKTKRISMSFATALSLSFNNLRTKKGRTILTSFAGSIGIIGIALILAVSTGMSSYITNVQKDTMSSYPLTISAETVDLTNIMGQRRNMIEERKNDTSDSNAVSDGVHTDYSDIEATESMSANVVKNNLTNFKNYLEKNDDIQQYLGDNGIVYSYDVNFDVYSYNTNHTLVNSDADVDELSTLDSNSSEQAGGSKSGIFSTLMGTSSDSGATNFSQLMPGSNNAVISSVITDSYDVLYGAWPSAYNEVVLVLDKNNSISSSTLYQLGLITEDQYLSAVKAIEDGNEADAIDFDYSTVCDHTFYLVPACDQYVKNTDGTFTLIEDTSTDMDQMLADALPLKITGIVRPVEDADNADIQTALGYTSLLTDYLIDHTDQSEIITAQEASPDTNVLTGVDFDATDDASKAADAKDYISALDASQKAYIYKMLISSSEQTSSSDKTSASEQNTTADPVITQEQNATDNSTNVPVQQTTSQAPTGTINMDSATMDEDTMAAMLDQWLASDPDEKLLVKFYDQYISGTSYEDNLKAFGKVSYDAPSAINIYVDSFEDKEQLTNCIDTYNQNADEEDTITYTDYVAMLTSSVTTIINGISYVLIAFVAISLIVSCIMIGIITHISVMERTKEIGILRALGASKRNISQVFNAETFIIGCCSGVLGIVLSKILILPINSIIQRISGISDISAHLSFLAALILIGISILITILGGLFPAKTAANKDPVIALRSE